MTYVRASDYYSLNKKTKKQLRSGITDMQTELTRPLQGLLTSSEEDPAFMGAAVVDPLGRKVPW
jgi:hypothetical protein